MDCVQDWMSTEVVCTAPTATAQEAFVLMSQRRVRHLLVKRADELVGILSNRDVVRAALAHPGKVLDLGRTRVEDIMTPSPLLVTKPEASLAEAARLLHDFQVSALPVLSEGTVLGIITTSDFLRSYFQGVEALITGDQG